ncbi:MAG: oxidoreductase [Edaphobacter sp.]|nr:oxidoreductase [Edaphobacter sp.]
MALSTESTTFTKDVLGRYTCSTWDEATADPTGIDVVVLGGGMYGGYCAAKVYQESRLRFGDARKALRVLVLEAGPFVLNQHTADVPDLGFFDPGGSAVNVQSGANTGIRNEVWGVGWRSNEPFVGQAYCVGGKGIFWGGWCPELQPNDLAEWPADVRRYLTNVDAQNPIGHRPIDHIDQVTQLLLKRGDPLSGYGTVEYEIGVEPSDRFLFDPVQLSTSNTQKVGLNEALRVFLDRNKGTIDARITNVLPAPVAVQTQSFVSGLFALDKYSSVPALIGAARDDHNDGRANDLRMTIVPNCHVSSLGFRPDAQATERGTRVINRIDVFWGGAQRSLFLPSHCQVVLAMSCIESTRLALESMSLVASGLRRPGNELMGRNYMVHLRFDISFDVDRAAFGTWVKTQWPGKELASELQQAAVHVQCEGASGRFQFQFYAATNRNGPDENLYRLVPDLEIQQQIADNFQSDKIRIVLRASGQVHGGRAASIGDPNFDYVDLAGDADFDQQFGHRRAWVQFNRGDHFNDPIWQEMHDTGHAIARAMSTGGPPPEYRGDFTVDAVKRQQGVGTTFHDAGCLWMGEDPDSSVTDVRGHFHHVTNAYCCDQALFTTIGSANPVLTGLSLARRVATDLVDRHSGFLTKAPTLPGISLLPSAGWMQSPFPGMLILNSANNGLLETNPFAGIGMYYLSRDMGDFDLSVEWKSFRTFNGQDLFANSGIMLRTPDPLGVNFSDPFQFKSFYDSVTEVQIDETGKQFFDNTGRSVFGNSTFKTGAIYGVAPSTQWAANVASPDGPDLGKRYWNTFEVTARGTHIKVTLNGRVVCEANVPAVKRLRGFLGLQFHTGRVQFRNLRLNQVN